MKNFFLGKMKSRIINFFKKKLFNNFRHKLLRFIKIKFFLIFINYILNYNWGGNSIIGILLSSQEVLVNGNVVGNTVLQICCGISAAALLLWSGYLYIMGRNAPPPPQVPGPDHIMDQLDDMVVNFSTQNFVDDTVGFWSVVISQGAQWMNVISTTIGILIGTTCGFILSYVIGDIMGQTIGDIIGVVIADTTFKLLVFFISYQLKFWPIVLNIVGIILKKIGNETYLDYYHQFMELE